MSRKTRRKIKRKERESKPRKRKGRLVRHLDSSLTNRWTKTTTYFLMLFEFVFVIWWLQELLLNWQEIILKLSHLIGR